MKLKHLLKNVHRVKKGKNVRGNIARTWTKKKCALLLELDGLR